MLAKTGHTLWTYSQSRLLRRLLFFFTIPYVCIACVDVQTARFDRVIIGEVMQNSELTGNLRALCTPGGRLSGSENASAAEQFVLDKCREYGLRNGHVEAFEMPCWRAIETRVSRVAPDNVPFQGALALCNTMSTPPAGVTAEVIDVGEGKQEDFELAGDEVRGRFTLVRDGGGRRSEKMARALEHDAAGLVVMSAAKHAPIIGTGHSSPRPEPGIVITHEDGQAIAAALAANETVQLNVQICSEFWSAESHNVVAELPGHGLRAGEFVVLGAHLDSWYMAEGAIDNGTGASAILEAARALQASGWRPRRSVRFVWFMAEEQDLRGSRAYVCGHQSELDQCVAMINVDMPGAPRTLYASGPASFLHRLEQFRAGMAGYELNEQIAKLSGGWSDHAPFVDAGVCSAVVGGDMGPGVQNYHTAEDKFECVDRRATVESAAVLAVLVRQLADDLSLKPGRYPPDAPPATAPAPSSATQPVRHDVHH